MAEKEQVSMQMSLVIAVVDDFTGCPVRSDRLDVWAEGERRPIVKEGGYYIFSDLREKSIILHLEGKVFFPQILELDEEVLAQYQNKVLKVRMLPNRAYPIPDNTTCVGGHAPCGSVIMAYNRAYENPFKLLTPYTKGSEQIAVFHPDDMELEGKTLLIQDKEQTHQDIFRVTDKSDTEKKTYQMEKPLLNSYKKIGTTLYPVYVTEADKNGEFYLPIRGVHAKKTEFSIWLADGKKPKEKVLELSSGRLNKIDF